MLLNSETNHIESHGILSEAMFGFSEKDQAHLFSILRDKTYSDKIGAVIREYSTNAVDSHVESGIHSKPIQVTLPTLTNPFFKVRDFGFGLSEEDIYEVYTKYGASTKRNSNDLIGALGLGSKSGFAYSNNFTITSYFNNVKSIYHAYIDESSIGKVSKLHRESTEEPSGIEISIPVKKDDFGDFREKAKKCFTYFDVKPDCGMEIPVPKYIEHGANWRIRAHSYNDKSKCIAIMGNIGYPINAEALSVSNELLTSFLETPFNIDFKIGDLSVSASRESLEYTQPTKDIILKRIKEIAGELRQRFSSQIFTCTSVWEARKKYGELFWNSNYNDCNFIRSLSKTNDLTHWNGKSISAKDFSYQKGPKKLLVRMFNPKQDLPTNSKYNTTCSFRDSGIIMVKVDTKHAWVKRALALRQYLLKKRATGDTSNFTILAIKETADISEGYTFEQAIQNYIELHGLDGITVHSLLNLPPEIIISEKELKPTTAPEKIKSKAFLLKDNKLRFQNGGMPSEDWEAVEVDLKNGNGVYLTIDRFRPINDSAKSFQEDLNFLKNTLKVEIADLSIYGFRVKAVDNLGPGWKPFDLYLTDTITNWFQTNKDQIGIKIADRAEYQKFSYSLNRDTLNVILGEASRFNNSNNLLLQFCQNLLRMRSSSETNTAELNSIQNHIGKYQIKLDLNPSYQLGITLDKIKNLYPMLIVVNLFNDSYGFLKKDSLRICIDYINQVDQLIGELE